MEPITTAAIAGALGTGLVQVGHKLFEKGIVEPALEPATKRLEKFVQRGPDSIQADQALIKAVQAAFKQAEAPDEDEDSVQRWLKNVGLDRLTAEKNKALRRQLAQAILGFTDPETDPPEDITIALGWPRTQLDQLSQLLAALRAELYRLDDWRAPIEYADEAAKLGGILSHLARANTEETELQGTSPVAMYPLGASQPFGLLDLAGNVWEWVGDGNVQRGGAWLWEMNRARCGSHYRYLPYLRIGHYGFRLVSPVGSGS